jgi:hypothetical protein
MARKRPLLPDEAFDEEDASGMKPRQIDKLPVEGLIDD